MNEKIKEARGVALDILKPSPRDLEHGLELHRHSVVCDTYGFAPRSAIDGDAVQAAIESGASKAELQDMEEDMGMTRCATAEEEGKGLMTEALRDAVLPYALRARSEGGLGLHRIQAGYVPDNTRSAAVLERLGFERIGVAKEYLHIGGRWCDHVLTQILAPGHR